MLFTDGVMEIASYLIVILLMDRIGRRFMLISWLVVCGVGLICSAVIAEFASNTGKYLPYLLYLKAL